MTVLRGCLSARIAACLLLASLAPGKADPAPVIHYAPAESLEHVDVALIDRAEHEIDMAAYVLTDWAGYTCLTKRDALPRRRSSIRARARARRAA
jgi:hypothetical protein